MTIRFEKIARDSAANERRQANGEKLIYDYAIMVDGVLRGYWARHVFGVGFYLARPDRREIKERHARWETSYKISKADFEGKTAEILESGVLPTVEEWSAIQKDEAWRSLYRQAVAEDIARDDIVRAAAPDMLRALREVARWLDDAESNSTRIWGVIHRALHKAAATPTEMQIEARYSAADMRG